MDRQELTQHTPFYIHEDDHSHLHLEQVPKLKPVSSVHKSEQHLPIPHLLVSQDEAHPSLNKIVSGLFHIQEALRTPHSSCGDLEVLHKKEKMSSTVTAKSTAAPITSLRKSSSVGNWNGITSVSALKDAIVSDSSRDNAMVLSKYGNARQSAMISSASSTQPPPSNSFVVHPHSEHQNDGLKGGVFRRGFFSKPVMHSKEENDRYLMTLDR
ncbi:unnamed protein product [Cylicocyclus nassatus]|uniref:Uncharacterized protein n=1 Tax=Cylicocyclus nassatus TaxID=53992 RepID=A0AA36HGF8_CYLNA|nr:unnamed protein product [Cylicocyclus nassatus]